MMIVAHRRTLSKAKFYLLIYFCSFYVVSANNLNNWRKLEKYAKCMVNVYGISSWKIVIPTFNSTAYNHLNYQWNKVFDFVSPIAIFTPRSVADVQATVKCGYAAGIQLVPNSGSHSFAGLSAGTNNSIVVDFRYMNSIEVNNKEESVLIGPGALVGHVNAKIWKNGGWGVPFGTCSTVAIGGHGLGGGYGFYSGVYGLLIDNMLEIKMVDAQGNALTVNATQNTDLWWALRGVGPGYIGLVTSYKFKMFRARDVKVTYVQIVHKVKDFQYVLGSFVKWLDWVKENNDSVTTIVTALHDDRPKNRQGFLTGGVDAKLFHIEDPNIKTTSNKAMLAAFPKYFTNATKTIVREMSYIEFVIISSFSPVTLPRPPLESKIESRDSIIQKHLNFFSLLSKDIAVSLFSFDKSFFVNKKVQAHDLTDVQKVVDRIPKTCEAWFTTEQGAIAARRSTDSAYVHRETLFDLRYHCDGTSYEDLARGRKWMNEFGSVTKFMDSGYTYQNLPDKELKDYLHRYYGKNLKRLVEIKTKWDPNGYFNSEQSIPTKRRFY